jgi:hypothetical protein
VGLRAKVLTPLLQAAALISQKTLIAHSGRTIVQTQMRTGFLESTSSTYSYPLLRRDSVD